MLKNLIICLSVVVISVNGLVSPAMATRCDGGSQNKPNRGDCSGR